MGRRRIKIEKKKKGEEHDDDDDDDDDDGLWLAWDGMDSGWDNGKSRCGVLDIVYRVLGLGVSKTRWVLVMDGCGGFSSMGVGGCSFPECAECQCSVTVRRFGRCQCQF